MAARKRGFVKTKQKNAAVHRTMAEAIAQVRGKTGHSLTSKLEGLGEQIRTGVDQFGNTVKFLSNPVKNAGDFISRSARNVKDVVKSMPKLLGFRGNHPDWYTNYPASKLVNINLSTVRGTPDMRYPLSGGGSSIPSVASIVMQPTVPHNDQEGWQDGIRRLFTTLRQANRSSVPYTMYDVEKYVIAVRSLHIAYAYANRAYGCLNAFKTLDRAIPEQWLIAMGLDPNDFAKHLADLRSYGTRLGMIIAANAPLHIPLYDRVRWMFGNIFSDSPDAKPNYYLFSLSGAWAGAAADTYVNHGLDYFIYNPADGSWVWRKQTINDPIGYSTATTFGMNYDTFTNYVDIIFAAFRDNHLFADISGDILNAFGSEAIFPAVVWEDNYVIDPIFDEAALTQIQNLKTVGFKNSADDNTTLDVYIQGGQGGADPNPTSFSGGGFLDDVLNSSMNIASVFSWPNSSIPQEMKNQIANIYNNHIDINWYKDNITPGEVMSACRLNPASIAVSDPTNSLVTATFSKINTEVPIIMYTFRRVEVYPVVTNPYDVAKDSNTTVMLSYVGAGASDAIVASIVSAFTEKVSFMSSFDYHPRYYYMHRVADGSSTVFNIIPFWDYNVYGTISEREIMNYNAIGDLSLLYVDFLKRSSKVEAVQLES